MSEPGYAMPHAITPPEIPRVPERVGYLVSRFPDVSEAFIRYELEEMAKLAGGVDVFPLVAGPARPDSDPALAAAGIRVFFLPAHPGSLLTCGPGRIAREAFGPLLRLARCAPLETFKCLALLPRMAAIGRRAAALGVTHLHAHFAALPADAAAVIHCLFGIPYSVTAHAYDLRGPLPFMHWKMAGARFGVAVSDWSAARASALTAGLPDLRWHVVRNGIPLGVFQACDRGRTVAPPLRVLSVGRLVPKKGFEDLLLACAILRAAGVAFSCRVVGDGPLRRRLTALARRLGLDAHVSFAGSLAGEALLRAYADSDVFVLACRPAPDGETDTLPVVLTEAMAAGLPVVSTRLAAIPELIEDGFSGLLAEPGDPASLARALGSVLLDPGLRAGLAQRARTTVVRGYDVRNTAAALLRLMRRPPAPQGRTGDSHAVERGSPPMGPGDGRRPAPDRHPGAA
jgi:glycosyltransferase involved in cell wall biosynthesis